MLRVKCSAVILMAVFGTFADELTVTSPTLIEMAPLLTQSPPTHVAQTGSGIVASPYGYLTLWTERRAFGYSIRGLRFAPDGSRLDDNSFEIEMYYSVRVVSGPVSAVFDGQNYVVGWSGFDGPLYLARISPQGAPDVRHQTSSLNGGRTTAYLFAQNRELFACRGADTLIVPDVHIWKIGADGVAGPEVVVHGYGAFSDGENLFSIGVKDTAEVYKIALDLGAANAEISTNTIGAGVDAHIAQLRHGFVVQLFEAQETNSSFVYFSNGQERLRGSAAQNIVRAFADTDDRLLMVTLPPQGSHLSRFDSFNLATSERTSIEVDLGNVTALHVAGSGADFFGVTDSFNSEMQYVGRLWITEARPPAFGEQRISPGAFATTLSLNATRRYRIETSTDLVNWTLQDVVSGSASVDVTPPAESQGFVRALLVPE